MLVNEIILYYDARSRKHQISRIRFNSVFYLTFVMIVHTMGSHIVRTLRAFNLYKLA
jgi:hypothetical protein